MTDHVVVFHAHAQFWGIQHFFCNRSISRQVTILAPRWTREIAGFMPWSVIDYTVEDSYVHVGDDAVAIMSGTDEAGRLWPTRTMVFRRLFVRGRSVAVGSADSGNITDVLFEDCTVGDDAGSSPWAFKIKMHVNAPSHVSGIVFRNTKFGNITSNTWQDAKTYPALQMGMNYGNAVVDPTKGQPRISNISFINVTAAQTTVVGAFAGASTAHIEGLHFKDCDFQSQSLRPWQLVNVSVSSCSSENTSPPFPSVAPEAGVQAGGEAVAPVDETVTAAGNTVAAAVSSVDFESALPPAMHILYVDDFLGSAGQPLQQSVQSAIDAAIDASRRKPTTLRFAHREYRLASPNATARTPVLQVVNASGGFPLRIDGMGASLVVTTPMAGLFSIQNASQINVRNLTVDYDPLPMTQGFVTAVQSPTEYTVQLIANFPSLMMPQFMETIGGGWGVGGAAWVIVKDRERPTVHKNGTLNLIRVAGWKDRGSGKFDVTLKLCSNCTICSGCTLRPEQYAEVAPMVGDPVVHLARFDGYPTFGLGKCVDCTFDAITVHASPAGTWVGVSVSGLRVSNVAVVPKPGRWHTTSADGVFVLDARVGPVVENSEFLAIGDDMFIVKTFSGICYAQQGGTATYVLGSRTHWSWNSVPLPGDVVSVWDPVNASGLPAASGVVVSASRRSSTEIEINLAKPLPPAVTCGLDSKLQWVNDALTGPGFRLVNTTIQSRRFGVLCMGRDGEIVGNRFVDNPGPSILLINDDDYDNPAESRMGYMPRNILIANNSFINSSRCVPDPYHAGTAPSLLSVIGSAVVGPNDAAFGTVPEPFARVSYLGVQNITIVGNTIDRWYRGSAILLGEAHGATVGGNTISRPPDAGSAAVMIADSDKIVVTDNVLVGRWPSVDAAIQVVSNSTHAVTVSGNILRHEDGIVDVAGSPPPPGNNIVAPAIAAGFHNVSSPDIYRVGNKLLDRRNGKPVYLKGVAMMGGEYSCVSKHGIFAGPADHSVIDGMATWGINAIRLPMNEDCWLGLHGVDPRFSGTKYISRFVAFVELALSRGFVVVLDLHWTNSTGGLAVGQDFLMSRHSPEFWASVATHPALRNRPGVVFELFNEPHQGQGFNLTAECFLNGSGCRFAGYNQAVQAVRTAAKATNLLLFAGPNWNFDLQWLLDNWPTDPLGNAAAAWHPYEFKCRYFDCLNTSASLTSQHPVFVTEWSPGYPQSNHASPVPDLYSGRVQQWAEDMPGTIALFPWVWNPGDHSERLNSAESDYTGSVPTAWGKQYKEWAGPGGGPRLALETAYPR